MAKHDDFVVTELAKVLRPGEKVLATGFGWRGPGVWAQALLLGPLFSWLVMKYFYGAVTDQRLALLRVKMGFFGVKKNVTAVESIERADIASIEQRGAMNQRRLVIGLSGGGSKVLRFNTIAKFVSGQKEFCGKAVETFRR
ncbi:MAG: hypothetical protein MUE73_02735 [Planctomycetes bacterium]|jgi:hypothetical protein|nr:hypothetical protein [Planctomycetota bacterium]